MQITQSDPIAARGQAVHEEADRLRAEIHRLIVGSPAAPKAAIDAALPEVARLQVLTANFDACGRPGAAPRLAAALVGLADERLRRQPDAIERGMAYTGDATMRRLLGGE